MCTSALPACMYVPKWAQYLWRSEEGFNLITGVRGNYEPHWGLLGCQPGPLNEPTVLLETEPFALSRYSILKPGSSLHYTLRCYLICTVHLTSTLLSPLFPFSGKADSLKQIIGSMKQKRCCRKLLGWQVEGQIDWETGSPQSDRFMSSLF